MICTLCRKVLTTDEEGLNRKLIRRDIEEMRCLAHLAEYFGVSEDVLDHKILQFKKQGCLLFSPLDMTIDP